MYKNTFAPVIGAAVAAAQAQIEGTTGAGGAAGAGAPPQNMTRQNPVTGKTMWGFMIGVDKIGDPNATFLEDGRVYDFGD